MKLIKKLFPFSFKEKKNVGSLVVSILLQFAAVICFWLFYDWFIFKFHDITIALMNFIKLPQWIQDVVSVFFAVVRIAVNWLSTPYMITGSVISIMDYLKVFKE